MLTDMDIARPRVLVVDDEADVVASLRDTLQAAGFETDGATSGEDARRAASERAYSLMLLDLRLKTEDGLTLARRIRESTSTPIIMISGSSDETDRVLLLEVAADDFLVKPFSGRELIARIRAVLRRYDPRPEAPEPAPPPGPAARKGHDCLGFDDWVLDLTDRELRRASGEPCPLTQGEFRLLEAFVRHPGRVWTRDQLLEQTRSLETEVFDRTIDVLILRLRRKIEANPKHPTLICTERGLGYHFAGKVSRP